MVLVSNNFEGNPLPGSRQPNETNYFKKLIGQSAREFFKPWRWAILFGIGYGIGASIYSHSHPSSPESSLSTNAPAISQPVETNQYSLPTAEFYEGLNSYLESFQRAVVSPKTNSSAMTIKQDLLNGVANKTSETGLVGRLEK
ncbi:hypothetical protein KA107_00660 [Candidatus Pacearchaeota archaeon]|nr:hypothetical protein [Candidatus Pacearchaeota archaeon]